MSDWDDKQLSVHRAPGEACPPEERLWKLLTNALSEQEVASLLEHVSACDRCGNMLRELTSSLDPSTSPEEEQAIQSLQSSTEAWQMDLAKRLAGGAQSDRTRHRRPRTIGWRFLFAFSLSTVCAAALVFVIWSYRHQHSIDTLLASAYDQQRMTELRLPGGSPVPLHSPMRGEGDQSATPELLEARAIAERALRREPENPKWHEALGRIDLVAMQPQSALAEFQIAQARNTTLPHLEFELGAAYFELGEQTGDRSNFGYAAEHFTRYIDSSSEQRPLVLYDRALCWEKTGVPELARKDLLAALAAERDRRWRDEINSELQSLPGSPRSHANPTGHDDEYEPKLAKALEDFRSNSLSTIAALAVLGQNHGDWWLRDRAQASKHRPSPSGDMSLSEAIRANLAGNVDQGLLRATEAEHAYLVAGNDPGRVRAHAEIVYALRRRGQAQSCLKALATLSLPDIGRRYSWLFADLLLERAACLSEAGEFDQARMDSQKALLVAEEARLPSMALRARGFLADFLTLEGLAEQAWHLNSAGLTMTEQPGSGPMRRYQFLSDLVLDANELHLSHAAALLAEDAAETASLTGNLQIGAYAWELVGQEQIAAGNPASAAQAFSRADDQLHKIPVGSAPQLYQADWSADRALLDSVRGQHDRASALLAQAEPEIVRTKDQVIIQKYWTDRAQIERNLGSPTSLTSAEKAVQSTEAALSAIRVTQERRAWQHNSEDAYLSYIESQLASGRPADAFREWLWFRGSADFPVRSVFDRSHSAAAVADAGTAILVYVRLHHQYVRFILLPNRSPTAQYLKTDPDTLDQSVRTFSDLCSDPQSEMGEIRSLGTELYHDLFGSLDLREVEEIRVDLPPSLTRLPLQALVRPDGEYLGTKIRIVQLPGWWAERPNTPPAAISSKSRVLIVDSSRGSAQSPIPAAYDERFLMTSLFRDVEVANSPTDSADGLISRIEWSDVFHFVGHGEPEGSSTGLVLVSHGRTNLVLSSSFFETRDLHHCQLAFLAACATMGRQPQRAEEPFELPSALLHSGLRDVVATHWDIDSRTAALFAVDFYRSLLKGFSPSAALMKAQEEFRGTPSFAHPYYWAAFTILEA